MSIEKIRKRLEEWKKDELYKNSKSFIEHKNPMVSGEYYFILSQQIRFIIDTNPVISLRKNFITTTCAPEPMSDNPNADIHRLNLILPSFDREFYEKVDEIIGQIIRDKNPDGFFG